MPYPETIGYIKKQLEEGISSEKIRKALENAGYQSEVIDKLMTQAGEPKQPAKKDIAGIEKILLKDLAIIVVFLVVVGSLAYISFFTGVKTELLAPKTNIKLDLSRLSPLNLEKGGLIIVDLGKYVKDANYDTSQLRWEYTGKFCVNIKISGSEALLRSIFLPQCPEEENIKITVTNPDGESASDILQVRLV